MLSVANYGRFKVAIGPDEVARLAKLARIDLSEEEIAHLAPQLDIILASVAQVSEAVSEDVPPTSHPVLMSNVFRSDEVRASLSTEEALAMAPDHEDGYFRVPRILEEEQ